MHLISFLCLVVAFASPVWAVNCSPDRIGLWSQTDVDNFQEDHGPCDRLSSLYIEGEDITNLDGLAALANVGEALIVESNHRLENIDGLSSLVIAGCGVLINNNAVLENVDGFSSLIEVDTFEEVIGCVPGFSIRSNPSLINLDGLGALERVGNMRHGGYLAFMDNASLSKVNSLSSLETIWGSLIIGRNPKLKTVRGFNSLTVLPEDFNIYGNALLTEVRGPAELKGVGGLDVHDNDVLTAIRGFRALTRVNAHLEIFDNGMLTDVSALGGLIEVGGNLEVLSNSSLERCQAFSRLVDMVDDDEPGPGPGAGGVPDVGFDVTFGSNLPECNSIEEILASEPLMELNAGLNDAWFYPGTTGQGFLIIVFPVIRQVFLAWFTYDTERSPENVIAYLGEPGHRWLTAQGEYEENVAQLEVYSTAGGVFDSPNPKPVTEPDGEIMLEFSTCNAGIVTYDISSIDRQAVVPIERIALDNVPLCYLLGKQSVADTTLEGG